MTVGVNFVKICTFVAIKMFWFSSRYLFSLLNYLFSLLNYHELENWLEWVIFFVIDTPRLNGLTGKKMQKIFEALAAGTVQNNARNLVEYCCFRYLSRDSSDIHPRLKVCGTGFSIFLVLLLDTICFAWVQNSTYSVWYLIITMIFLHKDVKMPSLTLFFNNKCM